MSNLNNLNKMTKRTMMKKFIHASKSSGVINTSKTGQITIDSVEHIQNELFSTIGTEMRVIPPNLMSGFRNNHKRVISYKFSNSP